MYEQLVARLYIGGHLWQEVAIPQYRDVYEVRSPWRGLRPGMSIDDVLPEDMMILHIWRFRFLREEVRTFSTIYLRYDLDMDSVYENEDDLLKRLAKTTKELNEARDTNNALDATLTRQQRRYYELQNNYMKLEKELKSLKEQCVDAGYRMVDLGMNK